MHSNQAPEQPKKRKEPTCEFGRKGCRFSEWDHSRMKAKGQTCLDWLEMLKESHRYIDQVEAQAKANLTRKPMTSTQDPMEGF